MPRVKANGLIMNYHQQGSGEPLILIPYLAADHACYAFQAAEYAKHFTCISLDLRGTGATDDPAGAYSTEVLADDVAAFMKALGIGKAHVSGLSLGAGVGIWLAAKYPEAVVSLSLHSGWTKTDPFIKTVLASWQVMAKALNSVQEMVICSILPWCLMPELYANKPEFVRSLAEFVRSRPVQSVASFIQQSEAVLGHDAESQLQRIVAPALITFGGYDMITSVRFADRLKQGIRNSELFIFEGCAHAPLYEKIEEFNARTLDFLRQHAGAGAASSQFA